MQPDDLLHKLRTALGRSAPLSQPPVPPEVPEPIVRLVHSDFGLPELFAKVAAANNIAVHSVYPEELAASVINFLRTHNANRIALPDSKLLRNLDLLPALRTANFDAHLASEITLDQLYDFDASITDTHLAVAEIGALVIRGSAQHSRALSLVPPIHIAILEPKNFVPDLVDLFQAIPPDDRSNYVLITGPSKTADIEMTLVTGVHGPATVAAFLLR